MKTKICAEQLWEAPPWTLYLETRGGSESAKAFSPKRPFVLIGSSELCDIRLDEPQLPPVAYIACCFGGTVEVWPTSAIAFPRWGVLRAGQSFVVGRSRISIEHPARHAERSRADCGQQDSALCESNEDAPQVDLPIGMYWNGKKKFCRLKRTVTLMGSDHPSMLRLQGQSLEPCDHALVTIGDSLWMIDLTTASREASIGPDTSRRNVVSPSSRFGCLTRSGEAARIGGLTIALESSPSQVDLGNLVVTYSVPRRSPVIHAFSLETAENSMVEELRLRWDGEASQQVEPNAHQMIGFPSAEDSGTCLEKQMQMEIESEQLAAQVTDRLVSMSNARQAKTRGRLTSFFMRTRVPESDVA